MKKRERKAFTLAEVLITLTILGVVAAIVIPTMMRNNGEAANRTKMKKAIASFEKVVETMRINEGYQTVDAMKDDMNVAGCEKSRGYFKTKTVDSSDGCIFQTDDGLWWNVADISKPIVALENGDDNKYIKDNTYAKKSSSDDEGLKAFYLTVTQGTAAQGYAFIVNEASGDANKALAYAKLASSNDESSTMPSLHIKYCTGMEGFTSTGCTTGDVPFKKMTVEPTSICKSEGYLKFDIPGGCSTVGAGELYYTEPFNLDSKDIKYDSSIGTANTWKLANAACGETAHLASMAELKATDCGGAGCVNDLFISSNQDGPTGAFTMSWGTPEVGAVDEMDKARVVCIKN